MKKMIRYLPVVVMIVLCILIYPFLQGVRAGLSKDDARYYYGVIMNSFLDRMEPGVDSEMDSQSIAKLLSSEVIMYQLDAAYDTGRIEKMVQWIIQNQDNNGDGEIGWGLNFAWDAFSDGSENPKDHVYAIETVDVLNAIMDYLELEIADEKTKAECLRLLHESVVLWNRKYWSEKTDKGEYFYWYSIAESDVIECSNISSEMGGCSARAIGLFPDIFSEAESRIIRENVEATMLHLYQSAIRSDSTYWSYSYLNPRMNDVIHHAFAVEGINHYINASKNEKLIKAYQEVDLQSYILSCIQEGELYSYPDASLSRMYDAGATVYIQDNRLCGSILRNMIHKYHIDEGIPASEDGKASYQYSERQLTFLAHALADYLAR